MTTCLTANDSFNVLSRCPDLYLKSNAHGIPHAFIVDSNNIITFSGSPLGAQFEAALDAAARHAPYRSCKPQLSAQEDTDDINMIRVVHDSRDALPSCLYAGVVNG